jgi:hypothetical protein
MEAECSLLCLQQISSGLYIMPAECISCPRLISRRHILVYSFHLGLDRPSLWSSGQCSLLLFQRSRVRFPAVADFLSGESGTGFTQPHEYN